MYKFRTMVENADKIGGPSTSADDGRITKIGKILRKYKIDELPQLWNVVKRDMNLVGPRPECPQVVEEIKLKFPTEYAIISKVKPGITDRASLWNHHEEELLKGSPDPHKKYMEEILPEKIRLQVKYVKNRSFLGDLKIILDTIKVLLKCRTTTK